MGINGINCAQCTKQTSPGNKKCTVLGISNQGAGSGIKGKGKW